MRARENMEKLLGQSGVYRLTGDAPLDWELAAYAAGFALVEQGLEQARADIFAGTAGEERLAQWEAYFLPHAAGCPAEERRAVLAARLRARPGPLTLADMPGLLLAAGIRGTAEEVGGTLRITPGEYLLPEPLAKKELAALMPLHLRWEIAEA